MIDQYQKHTLMSAQPHSFFCTIVISSNCIKRIWPKKSSSNHRIGISILHLTSKDKEKFNTGKGFINNGIGTKNSTKSTKLSDSLCRFSLNKFLKDRWESSDITRNDALYIFDCILNMQPSPPPMSSFNIFFFFSGGLAKSKQYDTAVLLFKGLIHHLGGCRIFLVIIFWLIAFAKWVGAWWFCCIWENP